MSRRRARGSFAGRLLEAIVNLLLLLVVLLFGFSIAGRFSAEGRNTVRHAVERSGSQSREQNDRRDAPRLDPGDTGREQPQPGLRDGAVRGAGGGGADRTEERPTVDIRNGCGRVGLAEDMMLELRRAGFDVVEYRNADSYDYQKTLVEDRAGKPEAASRVQDWLRRTYGVGELRHVPVAAPEADVLLILGADLADTLRRLERAGR
jgi:hypothetical protein